MKLFSKYSNLCDHKPVTSQTDRQTDRRTTCNRKTGLCAIVHRAVKKRNESRFPFPLSPLDSSHFTSLPSPLLSLVSFLLHLKFTSPVVNAPAHHPAIPSHFLPLPIVSCSSLLLLSVPSLSSDIPLLQLRSPGRQSHIRSSHTRGLPFCAL